MIKQKVIFSREECNTVIDYFKKESELWSSSDRKYQSAIIDFTVETEWLFTRLKQFFETEVEIGITNLKNYIHLHRYEKGEWFGKHRDTRESRMYAVGVCLNDEYEGGDFILYDKEACLLEKRAGNTYVFDVSTEHEITPIVEGERYSLIWFLENNNLKIKIKSLI
jgi:hypothetical protein